MKQIFSYNTGMTRKDGKPQTAIGYSEGKGLIMSFPVRLNNFKIPSFKEVKQILSVNK